MPRTTDPMIARLDQFSLLGMVLGILVMLQPWFGDGLRIGFFLVLGTTLLQIVVGRLRSTEDAR